MIIGAVRCPAHHIAAWRRDRHKSQSVVGDFASRPKEVNPMLQALRANGIEVAALHRHMLNEEPRLFFMHFWTNDHAAKLVKAPRVVLARFNCRTGEPHPGRASRSRTALRHRRVASVFRAVRDCPFASMLDGRAGRLGGTKALDAVGIWDWKTISRCCRAALQRRKSDRS
jgi:Domain of Unknown Function (DUF1259)